MAIILHSLTPDQLRTLVGAGEISAREYADERVRRHAAGDIYEVKIADALARQAGKNIDGSERRETATPAEASKQLYRHTKTGGTYEVIGTAKMQAERWHEPDGDVEAARDGYRSWNSVDMREVVVYRSVEHGTLWVRPVEEFEQRFTKVEPEKPAETKPEPIGYQYLSKTSGNWVTSGADTPEQAARLVSKGYQVRAIYAGEIQYPKPAGYSV